MSQCETCQVTVTKGWFVVKEGVVVFECEACYGKLVPMPPEENLMKLLQRWMKQVGPA